MCIGRCHVCPIFDHCWDSWEEFLDSVTEKHVDYEELKGKPKKDDIPF